MAGQAITAVERAVSANFSFNLSNNKITGVAGCNRFFSSFEKNQQSLTFANIGVTMMICDKGMDLEQGYLAALNKVSHYTIGKGVLTLFDIDNQPLATFNR